MILEVLEGGPCTENALAIKAEADGNTVAKYIGVLTDLGLAARDPNYTLQITTKGLLFLGRYQELPRL